MTNTRPHGFLNIPQQTKPGAGSFDTRPKQLEAWLAELPMADTGECARRIYNALREINRLEIPKRDRINVLTSIREPLFNVCQVLKRHYINQNLPLSPKNKKIAQLAIDLNLEAALSYKVIIEDTWTRALTLFNRKDTIKAIHHAMYYLSNTLVASYQIYASPPPNTWVHIHQLYLYAEENGFADLHIKDHSGPVTIIPESSIGGLYKKILLLSLISPYRLRQDIIERVYNALNEWSADCAIIEPNEIHDEQHSVIIRLTSDVSPGFYSSNESVDKINTRAIDTSTLVHRLGEYMLAEHRHSNGTSKSAELPDDVIKLLTMTWGGRSKRLFSRKTTNNDVSITIGLSATHNLISDLFHQRPELEATGPCASADSSILGMDIAAEDFTPEEEPELSGRADFDKTIPVFGISSLDNHTSDIWDPDFSSKSIGYDYNFKMWQNQTAQEKATKTDDHAYAPHNGNTVNESAGGHCILGTIDYIADAPKVQIGELIGIKDSGKDNQTNISIGVIRRIRDSENGIELGIQKLAPCAQPVATSKYNVSKSNQRYVRSLILPEVKSLQQPITLITHDIHKLNDNLIIAKHGYRLRVKLTKLVESSGVFSRFEFQVIKLMNTDKNYSTADSDSGYEDVWSLI